MRKRVIEKGNVRRSDFMRAVITDTLPEEVPIIFSNDGLYRNSSNILEDVVAAEFVESILTASKAYTKPYRYSVLKDSVSARGLALIHPAAQRDVALFYNKFDSLICHFCSKTNVSLRSPRKVGSTFFVRGPASERNKLKLSPVETVNLETTVSNPSSYFVYSSINRAHEFFDSNEYLHLEKKYAIFRSLDVSKCFNSIYTHTLYWAVDSVDAAKDSGSSVGFPNEFDKLMQSMNYNETNGICIGPEVSRVFAEVIFSEIDKIVIDGLEVKGIKYKTDYDFRRYVDDYYIFCHNISIADKITGAIAKGLSAFNLHLNEAKSETIARPFSTKKSKLISDANDILTAFFTKIIEYEVGGAGVRVAVPKRVMRSDALIRDLARRVKAVCAVHKTGYDSVSDYLVSALSKRVMELCDGFQLPLEGPHPDEDRYVAVQTVLIEAIFFFYTVNPTVRASLYVARAVVTAARLFKEEFHERLAFLCESVVRWTLDLVKSIGREERHRTLAAIPLEVLNILLPMREMASEEPLIDEVVVKLCEGLCEFEYFEIISFLFLLGDRPVHRKLRMSLFRRGQQIVGSSLGPRVCSQSSHLVLDLLACPFLPLDKRAGWFNRLRGGCGLSKVTTQEAQDAVEAISTQFWFVRWDKVDFLSLLRKKELSPVY